MGRLTVLALMAALTLALCASTAVAATERVALRAIDRELPPGLVVAFDVPAAYTSDTAGRVVDDGVWTGPPYTSEAGGLGSTTKLDWDVSIEKGVTLQAAAHSSLVQDWPVVAEEARTIPRLLRGRLVGDAPAHRVLTRGTAMAGEARYEAALTLPLDRGRAVVVRLSALTPSDDVAGGGFGRYLVQGPAGPVAPSEWNRSQIEAVLAGVRMEGSLPPRRIRVQRLGNVLRGVVVDAAGDPVAGAAVTAEVRTAGGWRPLRAARTTTGGTVTLDLGAGDAGRTVRLRGALGGDPVLSGAVRVPASEGEPFIVVLRDSGARPRDLARAHGRRLGFATGPVFDSALRGYAADLTPAQRNRLRSDPAVRGIVPDRIIESPELLAPVSGAVAGTPQPPQEVSLGIRRIGATESPTAGIDGADQRVPVDVAVIDTGIAAHPDLNVVGGKNCGDGSSYAVADNGHGTHVAGIIGAKDNAIGVVGVAPGARIWAVRALGENGVGRWSWVICALDFVADHSPAKGGPIRVANLSLGAPVGSLPCDHPDAWLDPVHLAVCRAVKRGVTVVVSAGNLGHDLKHDIPATYPETIVVPALADYDGLPGGLARDDPVTQGAACRQRDGDALSVTESFYGPQTTAYQDDDDLLVVWNWPSTDEPHALAAPGVCIRSTWPGRSYRKESGTSMASPHVAGAAALYIATHPAATPAEVLAALRGLGERETERVLVPGLPPRLGQNHFDESDRHGEPVLLARTL